MILNSTEDFPQPLVLIGRARSYLPNSLTLRYLILCTVDGCVHETNASLIDWNPISLTLLYGLPKTWLFHVCMLWLQASEFLCSVASWVGLWVGCGCAGVCQSATDSLVLVPAILPMAIDRVSSLTWLPCTVPLLSIKPLPMCALVTSPTQYICKYFMWHHSRAPGQVH